MDRMRHSERLMIIRTAVSQEEFKVFIEEGVAKAKEIIISSLGKNNRGLEYGGLEVIVEQGLEEVSINGWNDAWKVDAFMLALAGLEIEDKKIKRTEGIFSLDKGHLS